MKQLKKAWEWIKQNKKTILTFIRFWIVLAALTLFFEASTRSFFALAFAVFWLIADRKFRVDDKKDRRAIGVTAALYTVATLLMKLDAIRAKDTSSLDMLLSTAVLAVGMMLLYITALKVLTVVVKNGGWLKSNPVAPQKCKKLFFVSLAVTFVMLFIWLLRDYPGNMSIDSITFIKRAMYDQDMVADLPPVMILILRACLNLGLATKAGMNGGVAIYYTLQIIFEAVCVAYVIYRLARLGINKVYCYMILAFFTLVPYNIQYSHTLWKDIPFSLCCMIFTLLIWEQTGIQERYKGKYYIFDMIALALSGIGICILRANGYYAFILFVPFAIVMYWKNRKDMCIAVVATFILAYIVSGPVNDAIINANNQKVANKAALIEASSKQAETVAKEATTDEQPSEANETEQIDKQENVSQSYGATGIYVMTCQMLARLVVDRDDLTAEDFAMLDEVIKLDEVVDDYSPRSSHYTMRALKFAEPKRYLQIWVKLGMKYPTTYIAAWKDSTYGFWYPEADRYVYEETVSDNEYGIYKDSVFPDFVEKIRYKIERNYRQLPVYGLLWSIGLNVWITAFCVAGTASRKGGKQCFVYMPLIGIWLTLLATSPVNAEFRYMYPFFTCLPITILIPFIDINGAKKTNE